MALPLSGPPTLAPTLVVVVVVVVVVCGGPSRPWLQVLPSCLVSTLISTSLST
jgi:hypothetical protein